MTATALPLDGIKVLDLTAIVLGPLATLCLADLGAEVVKLEPPAGDGIRNSAAVPEPGMGSIYLALNRGKKSLVLDLKSPAAAPVLRRLAGWADVVVHNMRPASARALGIDYHAVRQLNPAAIYCSASGFLPESARGDDPAVDDAIQAVSGLASLFEVTGGTPRYVPATLADKICGLVMTQAILAGLVARGRTGQGMAVNIPMAETMAAFNLMEHLGAATFLADPGPPGYNRLVTPHRRPLATRDGYIAMTPYTKRDWQGFLRAAGRPDLAEDPRVTDTARRNTEVGELYAQLAELLKERDTDAWIALAREVGIPVAAVRDLTQVLADPELAASGYLTEYDHPTLGRLRATGPLVRLQGQTIPPARPAPALGGDTVQVLAELGYSRDEIDAFVDSGVAVQAAG